MTTVTINRSASLQGEKLAFHAAGHAAYGPKGADIVCAAVSILSYTLAREMEKLEADGGLAIFSASFEEGAVRIEAIPRRFAKRQACTVYQTILSGFCLLAEAYPENIRLRADFEPVHAGD